MSTHRAPTNRRPLYLSLGVVACSTCVALAFGASAQNVNPIFKTGDSTQDGSTPRVSPPQPSLIPLPTPATTAGRTRTVAAAAHAKVRPARPTPNSAAHHAPLATLAATGGNALGAVSAVHSVIVPFRHVTSPGTRKPEPRPHPHPTTNPRPGTHPTGAGGSEPEGSPHGGGSQLPWWWYFVPHTPTVPSFPTWPSEPAQPHFPAPSHTYSIPTTENHGGYGDAGSRRFGRH